MFADETKLYGTITSESDCNILQQVLNNVMDWEVCGWLILIFTNAKPSVLSCGIQVNNCKEYIAMSCTDED